MHGHFVETKGLRRFSVRHPISGRGSRLSESNAPIISWRGVPKTAGPPFSLPWCPPGGRHAKIIHICVGLLHFFQLRLWSCLVNGWGVGDNQGVVSVVREVAVAMVLSEPSII